MAKILSKVFISQESHSILLPHEAALVKTGEVPSPDYITVYLSIETASTEQYVGNTTVLFNAL